MKIRITSTWQEHIKKWASFLSLKRKTRHQIDLRLGKLRKSKLPLPLPNRALPVGGAGLWRRCSGEQCRFPILYNSHRTRSNLSVHSHCSWVLLEPCSTGACPDALCCLPRSSFCNLTWNSVASHISHTAAYSLGGFPPASCVVFIHEDKIRTPSFPLVSWISFAYTSAFDTAYVEALLTSLWILWSR